MKNNIVLMSLLLAGLATAQAPVSNFSISPNPVCARATIQITDLSTNSPSTWTYVISGQGPGMGTTLTVQNPTLSFNIAGVYSISLVAGNLSGPGNRVVQTITVLPSPQVQISPAQATNCPGGSPVGINVSVIGQGAGGPYTYSWSTGALTSSIIVSPSVTTVYTAVITATSGCTELRSSTITVSPATVQIAAVPASICPGSSSTLTATGSLPGPFTFSWSTGATTQLISTSTPGVYSVQVTNGNGCSAFQTYSLGTSTTLSLSATSNPSILCAGNTATLRVTGATNYTWSNGAANPNIQVSPLQPTTYTVYGSLGACSGTASVFLQVNVTPTVSASASPSSVCSGNASTLSAAGAGSYTWFPGGTGQNLTVTPTLNTTYIVAGNNPGCPTRSAALTVVVNPLPVLQVSTSSVLICAGEIVALAASGAATYTWSNGSNSQVLIETPLVTTIYTISGTDQNGCSNTVTFTQNVSECTGIKGESLVAEQVVLFPNPCNGRFTLRTAGLLPGTCVDVYNALGELVKTMEVRQNDQVVDISDKAEGLYLIKLRNLSGTVFSGTLMVGGR